jgi:hypothetical protein
MFLLTEEVVAKLREPPERTKEAVVSVRELTDCVPEAIMIGPATAMSIVTSSEVPGRAWLDQLFGSVQESVPAPPVH